MVTLLLFLSLWPRPCFAQAPAPEQASLLALDLTQFPLVQAVLRPPLVGGADWQNLPVQRVTLNEDGVPQTLQQFEAFQPGLQVVLAYNVGLAMSNRIGDTTRFGLAQQALGDWAAARSSNGRDDLSVVTNERQELLRSKDVFAWGETIRTYQPNFAAVQPGQTSLAWALDLVTVPNPDPAIRRAILYVTVLPDAATLKVLPNLTERARQQGAALFIWLVGAPAAKEVDPAGYEALTVAAVQTGGAFFHFTGKETLPDPETYFAPLRTSYRLAYRSSLTRSGEHELTLTAEIDQQSVALSPVRFVLQVAAPNPFLLSPPVRIERSWQAPTGRQAAVLQAVQQPFQMAVEFPDGHPRRLQATRLIIDGQAVAENLAEPFDSFVWNLPETENLSRSLAVQVEVVDELGLSARSQPFLVELIVPEAPRLPFWQAVMYSPLTRYVAIGLAGLVLIGAVLLVGRARQSRPSRRSMQDPLTQPVAIRQDVPHRSRSVSPFAEASRWAGTARPTSHARLIRQLQDDLPSVASSADPVLPVDISITQQELTFGSDPKLAMIVLNAPSIHPLHARLKHNPDGSYLLADAGSIAGTWINYAPVSMQGALLEPGDLVHLGGLAYRFQPAHSAPPSPKIERVS
jgi:hypothetical protein